MFRTEDIVTVEKETHTSLIVLALARLFFKAKFLSFFSGDRLVYFSPSVDTNCCQSFLDPNGGNPTLKYFIIQLTLLKETFQYVKAQISSFHKHDVREIYTCRPLNPTLFSFMFMLLTKEGKFSIWQSVSFAMNQASFGISSEIAEDCILSCNI